MAESIWFFPLSIEDIQKSQVDDMTKHIGIEFTELGDNYIKGKMPVDHRTRQPFGILHGGAHVVLAETLGSLGANLTLDTSKAHAVGLDINSNHIKSVKEGWVFGTAKPIHIGGKTQVWEIRIEDEKGQLLNISRLTMFIVQH